MENKKIDSGIGKNSRKKIYAFTLNESIVESFTNKVGHRQRSKQVESLISKFNKKGTARCVDLSNPKNIPTAKKGVSCNV